MATTSRSRGESTSSVDKPKVFIWNDAGIGRELDVYEIWNDKQGNRYEMRAVHPTDRELFVEAFKNLSEDSIQKRFFTYKTELSEDDLANLLDVDMRTSYTCVVTTSPDEDQERRGFLEQIIGISQYFMLPQRTDEGEMAFLVCDAFQGKGLATRMLKQLMANACLHGIKTLVAVTTATNTGMRNLLTHNADDVKIIREDGEMTLIIRVPEDINDHHDIPCLSPLLTSAHTLKQSKLSRRRITRWDLQPLQLDDPQPIEKTPSLTLEAPPSQ